ncbi:MAG: disulfide oxidoreductase [Rhodospirillales bacterium]|nr:disulfide oxidoreductase [Rhodospirillales bacterium]
MADSYPMSRLLAVLGPTNTGKTHLALERLMAHASGMIGFPLRLLARENYERVAAAKGADQVALITGEERILPARARYFVCTVESMPLDREVDFLAVDEIQLAGDPERGHIFTHRILNARGRGETMFLGAATMRGLLARLVKGVAIESRPRFSLLRHAGPAKLLRLPARSAVVAFSAGEVYGLAELIRRAKGGAAVVLGALSPRTRNAQVALYQAGEVDYLVATDAIGMGLNMDIDHAAFAALAKFDGRGPRALTAAELAQIAGRAGRHMNDGSFGTTADCPPLADDIARAIEEHVFPPVKAVYWRNGDLRFSSIETLIHDLDRPPPAPGLLPARLADDRLVLEALARDPEIRPLAQGTQRVRLLWEVCQIPDFRKIMAEEHARLLGQIYRRLAQSPHRLADEWLDEQIRRLDRVEGDIDTLSGRIAHIRTWTYVTHRADWVADPAHWQATSRAVEDRLSDALHERLTQRFVDRRAAILARWQKEGDEQADAEIHDTQVRIGGALVGRLEGFHFAAEGAQGHRELRSLSAAAERALRAEMAARLARLRADDLTTLMPDAEGRVLWQGESVGRLAPGPDILTPAVRLVGGELLSVAQRDDVQRRFEDGVAGWVARGLAPLIALRDADLMGGPRGLAYQLVEGLGAIEARPAAGLVKALTESERQALARLGVRLGTESLFLPALLKPAHQRIRLLLWAAGQGRAVPTPPRFDRVAPPLGDLEPEAWRAIGYRPLATHAIRVDVLEKLAVLVRRQAQAEAAALAGEGAAGLGLSAVALAEARTMLGKQKSAKPAKSAKAAAAGDSPFAILKQRRTAPP